MEYSDKSRRIETALKGSDDSDAGIIVKATSYTSPVRQAPLKDSNKNDESGGKVTAKAKRDRMPFPSSTDCSSASAKSCLSNHNSSSYEHLHHKPQTNTKKTNHQESDDLDNEIIVKTTSWPAHRAPLKSSNGLDNTDMDIKNFEANDESGGNDDIDDEVTDKAPRRRMKFPSSSDCPSTPAKSCFNKHNSGSCEHFHHKPQTSTKKTNQQELSEDNNSKSPSYSESTKKKAFCHLN